MAAVERLYECLKCGRNQVAAGEARSMRWLCQCGGKVVASWWGKPLEPVEESK